ncbi:uncharacterized protein LOC125649561 [Ostrea edulis]|uniref:uncharacterized protein LOC125649561 n=1 Tax=Ostrea edulis TaxID=37623 RepID=UPI0020965638|nr:uncharacterized protein LOC125649561 [Ostrea edulis]
MYSVLTAKCLVFLIMLPGLCALFWEREHGDRRLDRRTYLNLPNLLKESGSRHSKHLQQEQAQYISTVKRGDRFSINDLIAYLKGMLGSDEIYHTGRSTYVRWGAGG